MKTLLFALMIMLAGTGWELRAADAIAIDPDLPQPVSPDDLTALVTASPFTRSLNLSDSLVLTGIAYYDGKPVVTLMNRETKENYVVSQEPNAQGMRLADTTPTAQLNRSQAKIMIGTETVTVRYSEDQLSPEAMKKGGFKPGGGTTEQNSTGGGERRYDGPRRDGPRPSEEDMNRMKNLSDRGKEVLRQAYMESREKMMNASPEERAAFFRKNLERAEAADKSGRR